MQIFNANEEAKMISHKLALVGVLMMPGAHVEWNQEVMDEVPIEVHGVSLEDWEGKFHGPLGKSGQHGRSNFLRKMEVCHKELD